MRYPITKTFAGLFLMAALGPICFAAQLGLDPSIDIAPVFPVWAGYSAVIADMLGIVMFVTLIVETAILQQGSKA